MFHWILLNYIEILGVIFSLAYLWFSIRQNILLWPTGIISAIFYLIIFYQSKFYADMGLNAYYLVICIYGWRVWQKQGVGSTGAKMTVRRLDKQLGTILIVVSGVVFVAIGIILSEFTDSPVPFWDAFTTALSITATWMLAKRIIEHWILWIIVDSVSVGLYFYRELYLTLILFLIYTIMAIIGFIEWRKEQRVVNI